MTYSPRTIKEARTAAKLKLVKDSNAPEKKVEKPVAPPEHRPMFLDYMENLVASIENDIKHILNK